MKYTVHKCDVCEREIERVTYPMWFVVKLRTWCWGMVKRKMYLGEAGIRKRKFEMCDHCWVEFVLFCKSKLKEKEDAK